MATKQQGKTPVPPNSPGVFISYSRSDDAFVGQLEDGLQARGVRAFRDRKDIEKAEHWWERIEQLIRSADSIVFVLSPSALDSPVAQREVAFGTSLNKRFLPVVAADIEGRAVPEALAHLNYVYFIAHPRAGATGDFVEACDELVRALQTDIGWIREHTRLGEAAARWDGVGRGHHLLLRGPALEAAERWLAAQPQAAPAPTPLHRTFITAGRQAATRRLRLSVAAAVAVALLSVGLAALAWTQKQAATAAQTESFVRQADLSASLAFRLYEQGDGVLGLKVARSGAPEEISDQTPLRPRLALALQRGWAMVQEAASLRHPDGQIEDIAWSPDGEYVATATLVDGARLWRVSTGELVLRLATGLQPDFTKLRDPRLLGFSSDGHRLANQFDHRLKVWDVDRITDPATRGAQTSPRLDVACVDSTMRLVQLSPDGRVVAAQCNDGLKVWQVETGKLVWTKPMGERTSDGVPQGGWDSLAFVKGGHALLMLGKAGARLLDGLDTPVPRLADLPGLADLGDGEIHPVPGTDQVLVVGAQSVARVDLTGLSVLYRLPVKAERGRSWLRYAPRADRILIAAPNSNQQLLYLLLNGGTGKRLGEGLLNFTGRLAGAEVQDVDLSDDGRSMAVALSAGAMVLRLDRPLDRDSEANVQQLKGNAQVVLDEPCSYTSAPTNNLRLAPAGARIALACNGLTHIRRLTDQPAATLGTAGTGSPRLVGMAPARNGMLRLVATEAGRWLFERADSHATKLGEATPRTPLLDAPVTHWQVADRDDTVYWVDAQGRAAAWNAASDGVTRFAGHYPQPRALRVRADGKLAALLTAEGLLVHVAHGQAQPALKAALVPPGAAETPRRIPTIRYEIDPGLRHVAFTSKDLRATDGLDAFGVILSLPNAAGTTDGGATRVRCLAAPRRAPAAVMFNGEAEAPRVLYVDRSRAVATVALGDILSAGAELKPQVVGGVAVAVQPCPQALMQRFVEGKAWSINPFTDLAVALPMQGHRLLYSDGQSGPVELINPTQARSITDLVDGHVASDPIAVSPDGRYLALLTKLGNGVAVFDTATGTLLRRRVADTPVDPHHGALVFDPTAEHLYVRLTDGRVQLFALQLLQGAAMLNQVRDIGLQPMSDAERREIYEFRERFPRVATPG